MQLTGLHLLLTYQCNFECDHCFIWGSPRQTGTFTLDQVEEVLRQARELGTVSGSTSRAASRSCTTARCWPRRAWQRRRGFRSGWSPTATGRSASGTPSSICGRSLGCSGTSRSAATSITTTRGSAGRPGTRTPRRRRSVSQPGSSRWPSRTHRTPVADRGPVAGGQFVGHVPRAGSRDPRQPGNAAELGNLHRVPSRRPARARAGSPGPVRQPAHLPGHRHRQPVPDIAARDLPGLSSRATSHHRVAARGWPGRAGPPLRAEPPGKLRRRLPPVLRGAAGSASPIPGRAGARSDVRLQALNDP